MGLIEQAVAPDRTSRGTSSGRRAPIRGPRGLPAVTAEAHLARRAGEGDADAFAQLVDRHGPAVLRWARALLPAADAEDCVRETFLAVWRAAAPYRGETGVRTWLFTLVRRTAAAYPARRPTGTGDGGRDDSGQDHDGRGRGGPAGPTGPESALRHALERALGLLPPQQRHAWILREVERCSYRDVARVLGTNQSTVRQLLQRARTALAGALPDRP